MRVHGQSIQCRHTLHHDAPGSTWRVVTAKAGRKVECGVCKRFYGYMRPEPKGKGGLLEGKG